MICYVNIIPSKRIPHKARTKYLCSGAGSAQAIVQSTSAADLLVQGLYKTFVQGYSAETEHRTMLAQATAQSTSAADLHVQDLTVFGAL